MNALRGLALLLCLQLVGESAARLAGLALPGPVLGLLVLPLLLRSSRVREWVAPAAEGLLQHLSLLFVPVGVGVITHLGLVAAFGWQLALVVLLSTAVGLVVTATVTAWAWREEDS